MIRMCISCVKDHAGGGDIKTLRLDSLITLLQVKHNIFFHNICCTLPDCYITTLLQQSVTAHTFYSHWGFTETWWEQLSHTIFIQKPAFLIPMIGVPITKRKLTFSLLSAVILEQLSAVNRKYLLKCVLTSINSHYAIVFNLNSLKRLWKSKPRAPARTDMKSWWKAPRWDS